MITIRPASGFLRLTWNPSRSPSCCTSGRRSSTTAPLSAWSRRSVFPSRSETRRSWARRLASSQSVWTAGRWSSSSAAFRAAWRRRPVAGAASGSSRGGSACCRRASTSLEEKRASTMSAATTWRTWSSWSSWEDALTQLFVSSAWRFTQMVSEEARSTTRATPRTLQTTQRRPITYPMKPVRASVIAHCSSTVMRRMAGAEDDHGDGAGGAGPPRTDAAPLRGARAVGRPLSPSARPWRPSTPR